MLIYNKIKRVLYPVKYPHIPIVQVVLSIRWQPMRFKMVLGVIHNVTTAH